MSKCGYKKCKQDNPALQIKYHQLLININSSIAIVNNYLVLLNKNLVTPTVTLDPDSEIGTLTKGVLNQLNLLLPLVGLLFNSDQSVIADWCSDFSTGAATGLSFLAPSCCYTPRITAGFKKVMFNENFTELSSVLITIEYINKWTITFSGLKALSEYLCGQKVNVPCSSKNNCGGCECGCDNEERVLKNKGKLIKLASRLCSAIQLMEILLCSMVTSIFTDSQINLIGVIDRILLDLAVNFYPCLTIQSTLALFKSVLVQIPYQVGCTCCFETFCESCDCAPLGSVSVGDSITAEYISGIICLAEILRQSREFTRSHLC